MKDDKKDVGFIHDAIFMLQNYCAAEHHALESYGMSKNENWLDIAKMIRRNRSKWLYRVTKEDDSQIYCFTKHLLSAVQGLKELGNRFLEDNNKKLAEECFEESQEMEALIILINQQEE